MKNIIYIFLVALNVLFIGACSKNEYRSRSNPKYIKLLKEKDELNKKLKIIEQYKSFPTIHFYVVH